MNTSRFSRPLACVLALALLLVATPAWAQPLGGDDASPHSEAHLVSEVASIQPGQPFTVALRMKMEPDWHSYWKNPGDSGQPTSIDWTLPDGFSAGDIQWPYPHPIVAGPLTSYGYSDEVVLPVRITPPESLEADSVTLVGLANWLICAEICLPAEAEIHLALPVRAETPVPHGSGARVIAEAQPKLPAKKPRWTMRATWRAGSYTLRVRPLKGASAILDSAHFFPNERAVLDHAAPQPISRDEDSYLMALQQSEYAQEPAPHLQGVLVVPAKNGRTQAVAVDAPVDVAQSVGATGSDGK